MTMVKAKDGKTKGTAKGANVLVAKAKAGEEREATLARLALGPGVRHATVGNAYAASHFSDKHPLAITESTGVMGDAMERARKGDKALASDILAAQAVTLDTMFTELARRSAMNMGEYIDASERYMRLALKAQANCRATLEALGKLHQPRDQTVKHVQVNEGGQAVVADQIHQHQGEGVNGKTDKQSLATGATSKSPEMLSQDPQGDGVPIPGNKAEETVQDARREKSGSA
jgi:hypothetical protein